MRSTPLTFYGIRCANHWSSKTTLAACVKRSARGIVAIESAPNASTWHPSLLCSPLSSDRRIRVNARFTYSDNYSRMVVLLARSRDFSPRNVAVVVVSVLFAIDWNATGAVQLSPDCKGGPAVAHFSPWRFSRRFMKSNSRSGGKNYYLQLSRLFWGASWSGHLLSPLLIASKLQLKRSNWLRKKKLKIA